MFTVDVTVLKLETRHGWTYDGCVRCGSKPKMEGNRLYCPGCKKKPTNVEPKYGSKEFIFNCRYVLIARP